MEQKKHDLKLWKRREWLKTGAVAAGASWLPMRTAKAEHSGNELRFPPEWDGSPLVIDESQLEIWPNQQTSALTVNGSFPGPTIRLRRGEIFEARVENRLSTEDAVLHWHGVQSPAQFDGHPSQAVQPGQGYDVRIPITQGPSMCWYHSHTHDLTGSQVYRGLAGLFLIDDPEHDAALGLPTGARDVPLVVRDWRSNGAFAFTYSPSMFDNMWGYLGDTPLVNGTPEPWFAVDQGVWRFRILNGCNARVLRLGFSDNRTMRVIATDGGLIGDVDPVASLDLGPGQRAEILVSYADLSVGESAVLRSLSFPSNPPGGPPGPRQGDPIDLITFHVDNPGGPTQVPDSLPAPILNDPADAQRTRTFALGVSRAQTTINGDTYNLSRLDFQLTCGELEIWEYVNQMPNYHPMHVHGAFFQVLTRNGQPATDPGDRGWHDTVLVYPNETVRVAVVFGAQPGIFLSHCHNLEHERTMMQNFEVLVPETPRLEIRQEGDEVVVSWPAPSSWKLEGGNDLRIWREVSSEPATVGDRHEWREAVTSPRRYFRLSKVGSN